MDHLSHIALARLENSFHPRLSCLATALAIIVLQHNQVLGLAPARNSPRQAQIH